MNRFTRYAIFAIATVLGLAFYQPPEASALTQSIKGADPSVIRIGTTYYAVDTINKGTIIQTRSATSLNGLASATPRSVWTANSSITGVWAPKLIKYGTRYYIYFCVYPTGGSRDDRRMYVISSNSPASGYGGATKVALPDNQWSIDGSLFTYNGQAWFVWSGWASRTNTEQNIYIARMASPYAASGQRYVISQPREPWEKIAPGVNEAPIPIKDPNGQLHLAYSTNSAMTANYCIAELRLRSGGNPAYIWDWYKSNGCLISANASTLMTGGTLTRTVNGPGSHTFVLLNGDIATSPPAGASFPFMYSAVPKSIPYDWRNRNWYISSFSWKPNVTYRRANVPGATTNTGWSIKFAE